MSAPDSKAGSVFEWDLIRRLLGYTRPYKGFFFLALGLTLAVSALAPLSPWLFQKILDGPVAEGNSPLLLQMILLTLGLLILSALLSLFNTYLTNWLGQSIIRDIRIRIFNHISGTRLKYFDSTPIGTLQTRTISDVETLNEVFSQGIVQIVGELLQLVAILVVMLATSWKLTLIVLSVVPFLIFSTIIFKNKVKVAFQDVRKNVSRMNAFLQEHITGMLVSQMFSREKLEMERFRKINADHRDAHLNSVLYYSVFFPVVEIIGALGTALLVWLGVGEVLSGDISFGKLFAFIMYISMFFRPIRMLADRFNTLQMGMVSAERIFKVLDTDEKIEDEGKLKQKDLAGLAEGKLEIDFKNVWFAYNDEEWVLRGVSFRAEPGEKIAIVGSTGAGKTTIINLLTRFYEIQRGVISLNGVNVRDLELAELRSLIGLVLQDVFLFSGSIYDNITLNNPSISLEKVIEAAKYVGVHDFIETLPGKYDYEVQERGATLSAGQRQLIAFARVLVYDPKILILDEATSNIDTDSEELIQAAVEKVMRGRTSIIIAHRLSTIQKADQILVMSKGQICEQGNHQELLEMNGIYKKLYLLQFASA
ncbi:MAG: ABC transporter ATP-binding protein [Bacteroidia bacterium]|nr:ABC transporter ATP-binding protein [Bacteroidia bacterium]